MEVDGDLGGGERKKVLCFLSSILCALKPMVAPAAETSEEARMALREELTAVVMGAPGND